VWRIIYPRDKRNPVVQKEARKDKPMSQLPGSPTYPTVPDWDGNGNGIPNEYGDGPDLDGNGIPDEIGINPDSLQPGYPGNSPDLDGNGNGIPNEYGDGPDLDHNGIPDDIGIFPDMMQPGYPGISPDLGIPEETLLPEDFHFDVF
jgi:hypothetical protein